MIAVGVDSILHFVMFKFEIHRGCDPSILPFKTLRHAAIHIRNKTTTSAVNLCNSSMDITRVIGTKINCQRKILSTK